MPISSPLFVVVFYYYFCPLLMLQRPRVVCDVVPVLVLEEHLRRILDACVPRLLIRLNHPVHVTLVSTAADFCPHVVAFLDRLAGLVFGLGGGHGCYCTLGSLKILLMRS